MTYARLNQSIPQHCIPISSIPIIRIFFVDSVVHRTGGIFVKLILFGHCMILCSKSNMCSFFVINALYMISCNTRSCYNETPLNISITAVHSGQFTNSAISHPTTFWLPVLSIFHTLSLDNDKMTWLFWNYERKIATRKICACCNDYKGRSSLSI